MKRYRRRKGSVLVEYLLLCAASVAAGSYVLGTIAQVHEQLLNQIKMILTGP